MIAVIQRVLQASVTVDKIQQAEIKTGLLILLGIAENDTDEDIEWLSKKIEGLRIFADGEGKMNLSVKDADGEILLISQFTLLASTKKGNRPSFLDSARPEKANRIYECFIKRMSALMQKDIKTGVFGADMKVALINDGPVTIIIDTKSKK